MVLRVRFGVVFGVAVAAIAAGAIMVWWESRPDNPVDEREFAQRRADIQAKAEARRAQQAAEAKLPTRGTAPEPPVQGPAPAVAVDNETFDMGVVSNTEPTTKDFVVYNKGKAPLEIKGVKSSCGCTTAKLAGNRATLPPGGQVPVSITIDPKKIRGFDSTKVVTILSNDPRKPSLSVNVHAKVDPEFELVPAELDFGEVEKGSDPELTMTVRQLGQEPIEVTELKTQPTRKELELSLEKIPPENWRAPDRPEYLVKARLRTDMVVGKYQGWFDLITTCKRLAKGLPCKAMGTVNSFFDVKPTMLTVYPAGTGRPATQAAAVARPPGAAGPVPTVAPAANMIVVTADRPIQIADASVTGKNFSVSVQPGDDPKIVRLNVTANPVENPPPQEAAPAPAAKPAASWKAGRKEDTLSFTVKAGDKVVRHTMRVYGTLTGSRPPQRLLELPPKPGAAGAPSLATKGTPQATPAKPPSN